MNNTQRKEIEKVTALLEQLQETIERLKDEEEHYYDNMPESFQSGDKGTKAEEAIDNLGAAYNLIEDAISYLRDVE
jgi:predicted RNase H-like nuclease (RuvC/YqgF family)